MQLPGVNKRKLATYLAATTSLFLAACGGGEEKTTITDLSQLYEAPAVTTSIETVPGYERISFQDAQKTYHYDKIILIN